MWAGVVVLVCKLNRQLIVAIIRRLVENAKEMTLYLACNCFKKWRNFVKNTQVYQGRGAAKIKIVNTFIVTDTLAGWMRHHRNVREPTEYDSGYSFNSPRGNSSKLDFGSRIGGFCGSPEIDQEADGTKRETLREFTFQVKTICLKFSSHTITSSHCNEDAIPMISISNARFILIWLAPHSSTL